ncbi:MAG: hypothetical protein N4Q32_04290 [Neisseriaceae bacterium]|nr:hypothetical protein [Neisseriaceae bacterium]
MKKILFLVLLSGSIAACSNFENKKIRDISKMTLKETEEIMKSLTPEQVSKLGVAVGECQTNTKAEVCNKRIKDVIK